MSTTTVRIPYPRRRWPVVAVGILVVGFLVLTFFSNFYVDVLWYQGGWSLRGLLDEDLGAGGSRRCVLHHLLRLADRHLFVTRRLAPTIVALTPEQEIVERFKENIEPYLRWAIPLGAAILSIFVGLAAAGHWQEFLLWRSSVGSCSAARTRCSNEIPRSTSSPSRG